MDPRIFPLDYTVSPHPTQTMQNFVASRKVPNFSGANLINAK